jgi:uncharacterized protein YjiS (DUF1127 family)
LCIQIIFNARESVMRTQNSKLFWPLGQIIAGVERRWRLRNAANHLAELDDHMLRDIGVGRCDIEYIVRRGRDGH